MIALLGFLVLNPRLKTWRKKAIDETPNLWHLVEGLNIGEQRTREIGLKTRHWGI